MEQIVTLPCVDESEKTTPVLSVEEVVALEKQIAEEGTSLYELMQRAGYALAQTAQDFVTDSNNIVILAGSGNNGGDGWVAAKTLAGSGWKVTLVSKTDSEELTAEPAHTAALEAKASKSFDIVIDPNQSDLEQLLQSADIIIDAILGTGFSYSEVREPYATWIKLCNETHRNGVSTLSADCPSGLNAQTGKAAKQCINADITVTMLAPKCGLLLPEAKRFVGKVLLAPLGM